MDGYIFTQAKKENKSLYLLISLEITAGLLYYYYYIGPLPQTTNRTKEL